MLSSYPTLPVRKRIRNKRNRLQSSALIGLMAAMACGYPGTVGAEQEPKRAVSVVVICDDAAAQKAVRESLLTHFRPLQDLEVVDKNGYSSLIVYAEKTVNDPKNPNGY